MKVFKAYFLNFRRLEKILFVAFMLFVAALWFSSLAGRVGRFAHDFHATTETLRDQRDTLAMRADVEAAAKRAIAQLDPASTLDSTRLQGELNTLATGLSNTIDPRPSERSDQFAIHSVQLSIRRADFVALERFYLDLSKRSPYINIEQCSINADNANPTQLNVTMQISSVEIVK
jgi:hypothetical protein